MRKLDPALVAAALVAAGAAASLLLFVRDEPAPSDAPSRPGASSRPLVRARTEVAPGESAPLYTLTPPSAVATPVATSLRTDKARSGSAAQGAQGAARAPAKPKDAPAKPKGEVVVHARDAVSRRPVNGASVCCDYDEPVEVEPGAFVLVHRRIEVHTEVDGAATLSDIPLDSVNRRFRLRHAHYDRAVVFNPDPAQKPRLALALTPGRTVPCAGRLRDTKDGNPTRATLVLADDRDPDDPWTTIIASADFDAWDDSGHYREGVAAGVYTIVVQAPGYCDSDPLIHVPLSSDDGPPVDFTLERPATLEGTVALPPDLVDVVRRDHRQIELKLSLELKRANEALPRTWTRPLLVGPDGAWQLGNLRCGVYTLSPFDDKHEGRPTTLVVEENDHLQAVTLVLDAPR
jgi:hypothetical protein